MGSGVAGPLAPPPLTPHKGGWEGSLRGGRGSHCSPDPPLKLSLSKLLGKPQRPGGGFVELGPEGANFGFIIPAKVHPVG